MSGFELQPWLKAQGARVEALLANRLARLEGAPRRLFESMEYSLLAGGKRLRPLLCLAFAEAVRRGPAGAPAEDAACALEYVHTYSLVHDDLPAMDDDDLRRGRPTNHKVFGEAMAILAGDALLTEAFALLASGPEPGRAALVSRLAQAAGAAGMVGGQVLDIAENRPAEEAYLTRLHRAKTGALLRAACTLGVVAEGGTPAQVAAAERYGDSVGLAFQIADDLLDVTSSAEAMGKPTGADAAAGRHTYPAVRPLEPAPGPLAALARYSVERST